MFGLLPNVSRLFLSFYEINKLQPGKIKKRIGENHKADFTYDDSVSDKVKLKRTCIIF